MLMSVFSSLPPGTLFSTLAWLCSGPSIRMSQSDLKLEGRGDCCFKLSNAWFCQWRLRSLMSRWKAARSWRQRKHQADLPSQSMPQKQCPHLLSSLPFLLDKESCDAGWPWTRYVAEDESEILILLPLQNTRQALLTEPHPQSLLFPIHTVINS